MAVTLVGGVVGMSSSGAGGAGTTPAFTTLDAWGQCGGTGLLNNSPLESGGLWELSGEGFDQAIRNPGGYATSPLNTYCFVESQAPIKKVSQLFDGPEATVALCQDTSLSDMVHVNFKKGDNPFVMFWKTGVGPSQFPTYEKNIQTIPTTPGPMEFAVLVQDGFVYSFAAGVLCSICWDAQLVTMPAYLFGMGQLHDGAVPADRLYNVKTYVG